MPNVLEVQIVGDISSLEKSLKDAEKLQAEYTESIKSTSDEIAKLNKQKIADKKLGLDVAPLNNQISKLQDNLVDLRGNLTKAGFAAEKTAKSISGIEKPLEEVGSTADEAVDSVTDLAGPLLEAGGATEEVTEGANALASALSGGLAGAISAAVGYLVQMYLESQKAAMAMQELNKEAAKTAGGEIAELKGLVSAASDVTLSTEKRLLAVKELQEEYPSYFGNLTKEQILNGDVATAVDGVSKALIARARASAIAGKLGENAAARLDLEAKREDLILQIKKAQLEAAKEAQGKGSFLEDGAAIIGPLSQVYKAVVKQIRELDAESKKLSDGQAQATKDSIGLLEKETEAEKKAAAEKIKADLAAKAAAEAKANAKIIADRQLEYTPDITVDPVYIFPESATKEGKAQLEILRKSLKTDLDKLTKEGVKVNIPFQIVTEGFNFSDYAKKLEAAKKQTQLFSDTAGNAVHALASDLASSLQTGNSALDAFVGSVIQGFADIAIAQVTGLIAKQAVATASLSTDAAVSTGNAVTAATETAAASGPAAAFVLPALVGAAIGFIAASFAGIKFAHGGIVPGGSYTGDKIPAMLNSGEAVLNSQQQANTLMAVANGNANSLQNNRQSSNFTLETKLRGSDLLLGIKREERKR